MAKDYGKIKNKNNEIAIDASSVYYEGGNTLDSVFEYSTTETPIGVWTNGKIIYRRVFSATTGSSAVTAWTNLVNCPNVDEIINLYGCVYHNAEKQPIPRYEDGNYYLILLYTGNFIQYRVNGFLNDPLKLVIEYTKQ